MLAPICLFTYNRLSETQQTIEALKKNFLASKSDLFVFSDGPKNAGAKLKIEDVREYLRSINGFMSVTIFESEENKGLAKSIISGVTQIIKKEGKVIVLEDDLITTPNFLDFMNQALVYYANNPKIHSISGYSHDLPTLKKYPKDYYLGYRACSWGWGTWADKWENIDWKVESYNQFKYNYIEQFRFMVGGSDMPRMLKRQMKGHIDSWAIRWCYDQFRNKRLTVFASKSKVKSIGFGNDATHTKTSKRFNTVLDTNLQREFSFENELLVDKRLKSEFQNNYSIVNRLKSKFF